MPEQAFNQDLLRCNDVIVLCVELKQDLDQFKIRLCMGRSLWALKKAVGLDPVNMFEQVKRLLLLPFLTILDKPGTHLFGQFGLSLYNPANGGVTIDSMTIGSDLNEWICTSEVAILSDPVHLSEESMVEAHNAHSWPSVIVIRPDADRASEDKG